MDPILERDERDPDLMSLNPIALADGFWTRATSANLACRTIQLGAEGVVVQD